MAEFYSAVMKIFSYLGDEFVVQLVLVGLLFLGFPKRRLFLLRYLPCIGVMILSEWLFLRYVPRIVPWNYLIQAAFLVGTCALCYRTDAVQALFLAVCIYCLQHIVSTTSYALIFLLVVNGYSFFSYAAVMLVDLALVMAAGYFLCARPLAKAGSVRFNYPNLIYAVVVFLVIAVFLTHYGQQEASLEAQIYLRGISALYAVATLVMCSMNIRKRSLEQENNILQLLLHKDEQQYEQAKLNNEKIQIKYHDIKQWENQGILDYAVLSELQESKQFINCLFFTGNRALDIILTEKAIRCEHAGIRFICTADGKAVDFMKPHHIYSLIGNALENAIENLQKGPEGENRELVASVVRQRDMCVIKVSNYTEEDVVFRNGLPHTSKQDAENHGYGVKSMQNVVRAYGGEITFGLKEHMFTVLACIPLPDDANEEGKVTPPPPKNEGDAR